LFPLAARLRCEPELAREAVVVFQGNGYAARVIAATRLAREAGIRAGHTLVQARALMPRLIARARDPTSERTAQEALLEIAESFSPRVEDAGAGVLYLDLAGLGRHYPGPHGEQDCGNDLQHAMERAGLPARIGIASSKLAARVAAGLAGSPHIVPINEEASFLAPLPIARLEPALEVAAKLERWGITTAGELARLDPAEVRSRLGETGGVLHEIARGLDPHPLVPHQPVSDFREGMSLEWPLVSLEPFLFIARTALERLCQRLANSGLGCLRLDVALVLEPAGILERSITLPAPTREVKTLLSLVRLDLEAQPPGAPVTGFTLTAQPDRPRLAQLSLFGPAALSPDRLATTLARLFALLGPDRVGSPRTVDGHRPERFELVTFGPPPPPKVRPAAKEGRGLLTVRTLRPPIELEVIEQARPDHRHLCATGAGCPLARRPLQVRSLVREEGNKRPRISGEVRVAAGPWGIEEEWWASAPIERDYWDIELSDGGLYRLYRERASGRWYADGIYD
jgi:protein ImuB